MALGSGQSEPHWRELLARTCNPQPHKFYLNRLLSSSSNSSLLFESVNQVRQLLHYYRENQQLCPAHYRDAFLDLLPLLEAQVVEDICSPLAYKLIRSYHLDYIHYFEPEITQDELNFKRKLPPPEKSGKVAALKAIPKALKRFFILFAKQVDGICTLRIPARLAALVDEQIESKLKQFSMVKREIRRGLGQRALSEGSSKRSPRRPSFKELRLIDFSSNRLFLNVSQDSPIRELRKLCMLHFRPIYSEVFESVLRLNELGYRDEAISRQLVNGELQSNRTITRWYDIIQVCDFLKDVEIVDAQGEPGRQHEQPIWFDQSSASAAAAAAVPHQEGAATVEGPQTVAAHEAVRFGNWMLVNDLKLAKEELRKFNSFVKWSVRDRTNQLMIARRDFKAFLGRQFDKIRTKSYDLKERLTNFVARHSISLLVGSTVVNVILMIALVAAVASIAG